MPNFSDLKSGTHKQRQTYQTILDLNIMNDLSDYTPVLCGTIPLDIDVISSDLDIIFEVHDFAAFKQKCEKLYGKYFVHIKEFEIGNTPTIKMNFIFNGFEFELFGQPIPVDQQNAYRHMMIEEAIIKKNPEVKAKVHQLKQKGIKTEPAFCQVLGLEGNPYDALITYGLENNMIEDGCS